MCGHIFNNKQGVGNTVEVEVCGFLQEWLIFSTIIYIRLFGEAIHTSVYCLANVPGCEQYYENIVLVIIPKWPPKS